MPQWAPMSSNAPIAVLTCRVASFSTTKSNVPVAGRSLRKKINMATTVKQAFQKLKENLEITGLQEETVATRQKSVREVLDAGLTVKESFLTGSYARSTMIAPLSDADVDIFAVLDVSYYHNYNGQNGGQAGLLDLVKRTLRKTYTKTPDISRNGQAVTICFDDFRVDVVPAFYRQGGGLLQGTGRVDAYRRYRRRQPGRHRHRRLGPAHLGRHRPGAANAKVGPGAAVVLRGWSGQHRRIPRIAEHGLGLEAAHGVYLR